MTGRGQLGDRGDRLGELVEHDEQRLVGVAGKVDVGEIELRAGRVGRLGEANAGDA